MVIVAIKFTEVFSGNKQILLNADTVLEKVINCDIDFLSDQYFCPDCKKALLTSVKNVDTPYFRTHKGDQHVSGCNFIVDPISKEYVRKSQDKDIKLTEERRQGLLDRYSLMKKKTEEYNNTCQNSSLKGSGSKQGVSGENRTNKTSVPTATLNNYFTDNILERMKSYTEGSKVLFVLHGFVSIQLGTPFGNYTNYQIRHKDKMNQEKTILSIGCHNDWNKKYIQHINYYLDQEIHVVMIGWVSIKQNRYIDFHFYRDNSLLIEKN